MSALSRTGTHTDRKVERTDSTLIAMGKRSLSQQMLHARRMRGTWEVDPWPLPDDAWRTGGWRVRLVSRKGISLLEAARRHHLAVPTVRELLDGVEHTVECRITFILDEEGLAKKVEEYRAAAGDRRSGAMRRVAARQRATRPDRDFVTGADLVRRSHLASRTVIGIAEEHPELGWTRSGRTWRLPKTQLDAWDALVAAYHQGSRARRSAAAKSWREPPLEEPSLPPITFDDATLTSEYARYLAGDSSLRGSVFAGMREAFRRADLEAGDA